MANVWSKHLLNLIHKLYNKPCFKTIGWQSSININTMMILRLIERDWYSWNCLGWQNGRIMWDYVMSWSRALYITGCTWFSHVSQSTRDLITSSFHSKILHALASSSLPPLWVLFCIVDTISSALYQLGYKSALALSGVEVLRVICKPPTEQVCLIVSSQKLSTDHAFLAGGVGVSSSINESYWEPMVMKWANSANESHWWESQVKWQEGWPIRRS